MGLFCLVVLPMSNACASSPSNSSPGTTTYAGGDPTAGKTAVTQRACTSCHSADLSGTVTPYESSGAYPANLTPDSATGIGDWTDAAIKTAILTGTDDEGKALCSIMPHFGSLGMTDLEATNIVAYLRTLTPVAKTIPDSSCTAGVAGSNGS